MKIATRLLTASTRTLVETRTTQDEIKLETNRIGRIFPSPWHQTHERTDAGEGQTRARS